MTTDQTTITLPRETKERLDLAREELFIHPNCPRGLVVERLLRDHEDVTIEVEG